jgi:hypothetical protein
LLDDEVDGILDLYDNVYDPAESLEENMRLVIVKFRDWVFDDIDARLDDEYGQVMQYLEARGFDAGPLRERVDAALAQARDGGRDEGRKLWPAEMRLAEMEGAAREREQCARIADDYEAKYEARRTYLYNQGMYWDAATVGELSNTARIIAQAIRASGEEMDDVSG